MVLPLLIAGAVALAPWVGATAVTAMGALGLSSYQKQKTAQIAQQVALENAKTSQLRVSAQTPESRAIAGSANSWDDFFLTVREYAPIALAGLGALLLIKVVSKK